MKSATFAGAATTLAAAGLAVLLTLAPTAPAQAAGAYVTNDLNMRAGPSTRHHVIRVLRAGSPVEILRCAAGAAWCEVFYRGSRGWVSERYLDAGYRPHRVAPRSPGIVYGGPVVTFEFSTRPVYRERPHRRVYRERYYDYDYYDPRPYDPFWGPGW